MSQDIYVESGSGNNRSLSASAGNRKMQNIEWLIVKITLEGSRMTVGDKTVLKISKLLTFVLL
jgi:hypothetical protein